MNESGMNNLIGRADRRGGIDPAALAAATLSAAITVITPSGPYTPAGTLIGITVLAVIVGFDHEPIRWRGESVAYSAVFALITWLIVAFPIEIVCSGFYGIGELKGWKAAQARADILFGENMLSEKYHIENPPNYSMIPPFINIIVWLLLFSVMYRFDRRRTRRNIEAQGQRRPD